MNIREASRTKEFGQGTFRLYQLYRVRVNRYGVSARQGGGTEEGVDH